MLRKFIKHTVKHEKIGPRYNLLIPADAVSTVTNLRLQINSFMMNHIKRSKRHSTMTFLGDLANSSRILLLAPAWLQNADTCMVG
jgi:hypothetical protein